MPMSYLESIAKWDQILVYACYNLVTPKARAKVELLYNQQSHRDYNINNEPSLKGKAELGTVDLLVLTSLDQVLLI
jgi:hypothetical protein